MKLSPIWTYLGFAIVAFVMAAIPLLLGDRYITTVFISVLSFFILGATFDFMLGYLRIVNFGVGGFLAAGAYTSALLNHHLGVSPWLGLLAGGAVTLVVGVIAGTITLRLRGIYIGLTTFFVAELIRFTISSSRDITRGSLGLSTKNFPEVLGYDFGAAIRWDTTTCYWCFLRSFTLASMGSCALVSACCSKRLETISWRRACWASMSSG